MSRLTKKASYASLGVVLSTALVAGSTAPAAAESEVDTSTSATSSETASANVPALTEEQLAEIGLTREDAEEMTADFEQLVEDAEANGDISSEEAATLREELLATPQGEGGEHEMAALPVWAAVAIVGCAGTAVMGSGLTQIQNALKNGASVDQATDIAIDAGVECVFGAVPGGAIGAAAQRFLTQPIKNALRPHVRKSVENIDYQI